MWLILLKQFKTILLKNDILKNILHLLKKIYHRSKVQSKTLIIQANWDS